MLSKKNKTKDKIVCGCNTHSSKQIYKGIHKWDMKGLNLTFRYILFRFEMNPVKSHHFPGVKWMDGRKDCCVTNRQIRKLS